MSDLRWAAGRCVRLAIVIIGLHWLSLAAVWAQGADGPIILPVEVVGANGTTVSVVVDLPSERLPSERLPSERLPSERLPSEQTGKVRALWMQVHGLSYADMASVQVNASAWFALSNATVVVAEPGRSYGGIGGGFATLKLTLPLPPNTVTGGANTIRFRFNRTDGVASGFRVLAFNFVRADGAMALPATAFAQEDPNTWRPPCDDPASLSAGEALWRHAELTANGLPNAPPIRAHCADCHAQDGRDLRYFNYSNASIVARSRFHGLSELQGRQIASYIRALPVTNPGRPWNPPYQPGPGLDARPRSDWAAGAGLEWALDRDIDSLPYLFPHHSDHDSGVDSTDRAALSPADRNTDWPDLLARITPDRMRPDGNLNPREIPISLQLPDWNHWLPHIHPLDAWGPAFANSDFAKGYDGANDAAYTWNLRAILAAPGAAQRVASGRISGDFDRWSAARHALLMPFVERKTVVWSPALAEKAYSTQLWQLVKSWEMMQEFDLEGRGPDIYGATGEPRTWFTTTPAETAPSAVGIPDGPNGMGGSALTNEYFNAAWYEVQLLLNSGNHRHRDNQPIDWPYVIARYLDLYQQTHAPEPARLLVAVIKALQSSDPHLGPDNVDRGWRPMRNVDPTIMVRGEWTPLWQSLPAAVKLALTQALLSAWMDKNRQYPAEKYYIRNQVMPNYTPSANLHGIAGGKAWEATQLFRAAGVSPALIGQLRQWGNALDDLVVRFHY